MLLFLFQKRMNDSTRNYPGVSPFERFSPWTRPIGAQTLRSLTSRQVRTNPRAADALIQDVRAALYIRFMDNVSIL
jgi:hypothetical protein